MIYPHLFAKIIPAIYSVETTILPYITDDVVSTIPQFIEDNRELVELAKDHLREILDFCDNDRDMFLNYGAIYVIGVIEKSDAETHIRLRQNQPSRIESVISTLGIIAAYYTFAQNEIESFRNSVKSL